MNRIQELIKELCPNGVEWKKLGEVCDVLRGKRLTKSQLTETGRYKVFHGGIEPIGFYNEKNRDANTVMVINVGASAGTIGFSSEEFWSSDGCFCISHSSIINNKFLYYYLCSNENTITTKVRHAGIPTLDSKIIEDLSIPLPPLPVQTEIVRILDKFVEQQEQLEKLIELRTKQYEYYREEMLTAKEGEEWETKTLGEIAKISIGKKPNNILEKGAFEYINAGTTCSGYSDDYNFEGDVITTPSRGEGGIGFVGYQNKRFWCGPLCYVIDTSENNKFIYHYLSLHNNLILDLKCEGGVPALNRKDLVTIKLQIPTKDIQNEIVKTLDSFESSISALTSALELSKKRYEHYRDEMLRF